MKYLSENEERHLLRTIREVKGSATELGRQAERDYVIIQCGLMLALRAGELAGLTVGDVRNKEVLWVRPEIAKMGSCGQVPICTELQKILKFYIKLKLQWKESIHDTAPLFVSRNGNALSYPSLRQAVTFWIVRAGLTTTSGGKVVALYSTHSLRHSCLMRMRERGVKIETIQKFARHKSLASTGVYLEATIEELMEAAEMR